MKKILLTLTLAILHLLSFAYDKSSISLIKGPVSMGGGIYLTEVKICIGQSLNWGGTSDFNIEIEGASYASFYPYDIFNVYNAYSEATCEDTLCKLSNCTTVVSKASGAFTSFTTVTYTTLSSSPPGFPIVPCDVEMCDSNMSDAFCFDFKMITVGVPTSISLTGNIEQTTPVACQRECGFPPLYETRQYNDFLYDSLTINLEPLTDTIIESNDPIDFGFEKRTIDSKEAYYKKLDKMVIIYKPNKP